jgi:hypothetical protein
MVVAAKSVFSLLLSLAPRLPVDASDISSVKRLAK